MLPRRYHLLLRQHPEFFLKAKRVSSLYLSLYILPPSEVLQACVIVPKKKAALSVHRHLLKRKISFSLKNLIDKELLPARKMVVTVNRAERDFSLEDWEREILFLVKKVS
jgi:ribonuclease P protein component